ncbi:MAG: hypothetical protein GC192_12670 [Bacteroidetes bacterium]|nr:hypothetical protein [Bacteroidota bacterium]
MKITDVRLLKEVQKEFRAQFPFLEMLFYKSDNLQPVNSTLASSLQISDLRNNGSNGLLILNGNITCAAMEQTMAEIFGLTVSVANRWNVPCSPRHRGKPLGELNYKAMHMAEDVVFV